MTFSSGATTITLPGNAFRTNLPSIEHVQDIQIAEDGTVYPYNGAVNLWWYQVELNLNESQRSALRSFVKNTLQFGKIYFTLTPDSTVDLGTGAGTALTSVYLYSPTYTEIPDGPGRFRVSLTLFTASTGTGSPA